MPVIQVGLLDKLGSRRLSLISCSEGVSPVKISGQSTACMLIDVRLAGPLGLTGGPGSYSDTLLGTYRESAFMEENNDAVLTCSLLQ